jgi:hypothetical protein
MKSSSEFDLMGTSSIIYSSIVPSFFPQILKIPSLKNYLYNAYFMTEKAIVSLPTPVGPNNKIPLGLYV